MEVDEEGLMFDDGTVASSSMRNIDNLDSMAGIKIGLSGLQQSIFGENKKKNYELCNKKREKYKGDLIDGLSGLMVGRKDITAKVKDFSVIKRITKNLENKLTIDKRKKSTRAHEGISTESQI